MTKQQKQIALVAAGALALFLLYRWYSSRNNATSSTGAAAPATSGSDFAGLAGQEQSDVAALQGQNQQVAAQEQADVSGLSGAIANVTSDIASLTGQEQSDVATLSAQESGDVASLGSREQSDVAALAAGQAQLNRATLAQVQTHRGGAFYRYYVNVTGHAPPAEVRVTNFVYQAWKAGVKASNISAKPHPSAPRNTQVRHPNPSHTQQKVAGAGVKTSVRKTTSTRLPAKTKPRTSGRRR